MWVEERLAVAAAQQEDEAGQIVVQLLGAVGGVAGESFKRGLQVFAVAAESVAEELQYLGQFGGVSRGRVTPVTSIAALAR